MGNWEYNNTSNAYDFDRFLPVNKRDPMPLEEDYTEDIPEVYPDRVRREAQSNRHKQTANKNQAKEKSPGFLRQKASAFFIAGLVVMMLGAMLYLRSEISTINNDIGSAKKDIATLDNRYTELEMEMENKVSFANIEEVAKEMGMIKADKAQITYIEVSDKSKAEIK